MNGCKKENHTIFTEYTTCVPRNVDMKDGFVDSIIDHNFRQNYCLTEAIIIKEQTYIYKCNVIELYKFIIRVSNYNGSI